MSTKYVITRWLAVLLVALLGVAEVADTGAQTSVSYQYDDAGRLKLVSYGDGTNTAYTLDAVGNRTQVATKPLPPGVPGKPTIAAITQTTATVAWTAPTSGGAVASYQYSLGGAFTSIGTALTVNLTGLTAGSPYTVTVQAVNTAGTAAASNTFNTLVATGAPSQPQFSNITATTVTVSWSAPTSGSIASYEYSVNGAAFINVGLSTSVNLTGLTPGTTATVQVRARDTGGNPGPASTNSVLTLTNAPSALTVSSIAATSATISWGGVSGTVSSYEYSLNGGSWINVGTALSANLSGLGTATTYAVSVHAVNATGASAASSTSFMTLPGTPSTPSFTNIGITSVTVSWSGTSGSIDHYEYSVNGGGWTSVGAALSVNLSGLSPSSTYTVQVRAVDASGPGAASSNSFTTPPALPSAPGTPSFTNLTLNSATVSWTAASGVVSSYAYSLNSGAFVSVGTALSVNLTGLAAGTTYTVQVHAVNVSGAGAASSASFTTPSVPAPPTGLRAGKNNATGQFSIAWLSSTSATSYQLFDVTNGAPGTLAFSGTAVSTTLTRPVGAIYQFDVEACNAAGCSVPSPKINVTVDCVPTSCL